MRQIFNDGSFHYLSTSYISQFYLIISQIYKKANHKIKKIIVNTMVVLKNEIYMLNLNYKKIAL
ncbi:hypothetical protein HMP0721_2274 [Pseudoramibacter alactolyticus ATCC 23263]|uniref:Uncharacterized protein n=1 Tax=Pseudoramibacter alactolyticus ATCC 23263 TaxID=887929 RepID=E6MJT9_9FIRM|nr:hypothetical protein HMP0721_2274 [Pseudoramibacter alactolyticus ATCC 23263]